MNSSLNPFQEWIQHFVRQEKQLTHDNMKNEANDDENMEYVQMKGVTRSD